MVRAAVFKLGCGDVQDPLLCPVRDQVDEAQEILAGITESHAAPGSGLKIGGGAGHVEGHHALILIPDIYHAV